MNISVIIPVLHEQHQINSLINHLRSLDPDVEIIVVDGDPGGSTLAAITDPAVICLTATQGRGNQLATGAANANGDIVLMLHADTLLPADAFDFILTSTRHGADWGAFRLGIDASGLTFRIIERSVNLRCKLFTLPYGDQAIFVTRTALQAIGGIPAIPMMEDVELARKLRQAGCRFTLLPEQVSTSPRRWQQDGVVRRTLCNWWLLARYFAGADPSKLVRHYQ